MRWGYVWWREVSEELTWHEVKTDAEINKEYKGTQQNGYPQTAEYLFFTVLFIFKKQKS